MKERASQPGSLFVPRGGCGKKYGTVLGFFLCPDFGWDRVNFPPSSFCVLDLVCKECS